MLIKQQYRTLLTKQNFKRQYPTITWTLRLRSVWLHRNVFTMLFLRRQMNFYSIPYWAWPRCDSLRDGIIDYVMQQKLYFLLTHVQLKSYTIRVSNFSKSCDYWTLSNGVNFFDNKTKQWGLTTRVQPIWYIPYVKSWSLVGVFIAKKIYRIELIQIVRLLIYHWSALNTQRLYYAGYPNITQEWLILSFLGTYYFKVLNF